MRIYSVSAIMNSDGERRRESDARRNGYRARWGGRPASAAIAPLRGRWDVGPQNGRGTAGCPSTPRVPFSHTFRDAPRKRTVRGTAAPPVSGLTQSKAILAKRDTFTGLSPQTLRNRTNLVSLLKTPSALPYKELRHLGNLAPYVKVTKPRFFISCDLLQRSFTVNRVCFPPLIGLPCSPRTRFLGRTPPGCRGSRSPGSSRQPPGPVRGWWCGSGHRAGRSRCASARSAGRPTKRCEAPQRSIDTDSGHV